MIGDFQNQASIMLRLGKLAHSYLEAWITITMTTVLQFLGFTFFIIIESV